MFKKYIKYKKKYLNIKHNTGGGTDNDSKFIHIRSCGGNIATVPYNNSENIDSIIATILETIYSYLSDNNMTFQIIYINPDEESVIIYNHLIDESTDQIKDVLQSQTNQYNFIIKCIIDNTQSILHFHTKYTENPTGYGHHYSVFYYNEHINNTIKSIFEILNKYEEIINPWETMITKFRLDNINLINQIMFIPKDKYLHLRYLNKLYDIFKYNTSEYNTSEYIPINNITHLLLYIVTDSKNHKDIHKFFINTYDEETHIYDKELLLAYVKAGGNISYLLNYTNEMDYYTLITNIITPDTENTENQLLNNKIILNFCKRGDPETLFDFLYRGGVWIYILNDYLIVKLIISIYIFNNVSGLVFQSITGDHILKTFDFLYNFGNTTIIKDKLKTLENARDYLNELKTDTQYAEWVHIDT